MAEWRRSLVYALVLFSAGWSAAALRRPAFAQTGVNSRSSGVPGTTARHAVDAAAAAMGGVDRLRSIKNVTLIGYAQYRTRTAAATSRLCRERHRSSLPPTTTGASTTSSTAGCCIRSGATISFLSRTTPATTSRCSGRGSTATSRTTSMRAGRRPAAAMRGTGACGCTPIRSWPSARHSIRPTDWPTGVRRTGRRSSTSR